jgi:hypothetical protein
MLKKALLALATLLFLFFIIVYAQFKTGNNIYSMLTNSNSNMFIQAAEENYAMGYIIGVYDSFDGIFFSAPTGVTQGQVFDVVKKYLEENPASRHEIASKLIIRALAEAFPIKK